MIVMIFCVKFKQKYFSNYLFVKQFVLYLHCHEIKHTYFELKCFTMSNSKYNDIPFSFVDTRTNGNKSTSNTVQPITRLMVNRNEEPPVITGEMIMRWLMVGLAQISYLLNQLRLWLMKKIGGWFQGINIPWFKLSLLMVLVYLMFSKDLQFNVALKSPAAVFADKEEDKPKEAQAKQMSLAANANPYAPVGTKFLKDKKTVDFIEKHTELAVKEMELYGVPASIKMAQALIESRAGTSKLAKNNNNFFGMKCFSRRCHKGHCTNAYDDHHKDFFRKYKSTQESWRSHSKLLSQGRYKKLQSHGTDYIKWAKGLKSVGYATDKNYDKKLIDVIRKYELFELDKL